MVMVGPPPMDGYGHPMVFICFPWCKMFKSKSAKKNGKYLQNCANVSKDMNAFSCKHHTSKAPQIYPKEKLDSSNDAGKRYLASRT
jgi:hypothetical protein